MTDVHAIKELEGNQPGSSLLSLSGVLQVPDHSLCVDGDDDLFHRPTAAFDRLMPKLLPGADPSTSSPLVAGGVTLLGLQGAGPKLGGGGNTAQGVEEQWGLVFNNLCYRFDFSEISELEFQSSDTCPFQTINRWKTALPRT